MDHKRNGSGVNPPARSAPLFGPDGAEAPPPPAPATPPTPPPPPPPPTPAAAEAPDPFDPAQLRLSQDFASAAGVRKLLVSIAVRKPSKEWFVRTHPDPAYRVTTAVVELKEDRETYLVVPQLWAELATEPTFSPRLLVTAISRQGVLFLWPVRLPGPDGKIDEWSRTALEAVELARDSWVRVSANMNVGAYDVAVATGQTAAPVWPTEPFRDLLKIGFRDRLIDTPSHPVLQRLRGE